MSQALNRNRRPNSPPSTALPTKTKEFAMFRRRLIVALLTCWMIAWWTLDARLPAAEPQMVKGTVVSASGGKLVMKDSSGKEQSFTVDAVTKITINGKPGKLEDLQETMPIQVTTDEKGKTLSIATVDKDKHNRDRRTRDKRVLVALTIPR
jgi:hypothetical protein